MSAVFPSLISNNPSRSNIGEPMASQGEMDLLFKLTQFEMQLPDFIQTTAQQLADEALEEIKTRMRAAGYAQSIIDGTTVTKVEVTPDGFLEYEITSERDSDEGFDIATAHEKGTKDHFIQPLEEDGVLAWEDESGQTFFSKGHEVSGIEASNIITDTLLSIAVTQQTQLNAAVDQFFTQTVGNP